MARLELDFLGDIAVRRDGDAFALPPSKKTRALLAYLALNARPFRREHLCELLWEIPDDPRGSLRWSLSKLRRLVDADARPRIVADRSHVRFDAGDVAIDVQSLRALAGSRIEDAPLDALEDAVARYRGNFLEGLELPNFHHFHAWCIAEREQATRAQAAVLRELTRRLGQRPERALPHARALVAIEPYDEGARASVIRLLVALGRSDEAEQQYRLGTKMLEEIRTQPSGLLYQALHAAPRAARVEPPAAPPPASHAPPAAMRFSSADGAAQIGRDDEVAMLHAELGQILTTRRARAMILYGKPGIGKSRLLAALDAPAREVNARTIAASAIESDTIRPFALWIDALRRAGIDATEIFGGGEPDSRDRLFERLSALVARESAERPVLLAFDDLQWCDESSAAALHYVVRMNADRPVLTLLAGRDDEIRDNAAVQQMLRGLRHDAVLREFSLAPLANDAVRRLVAQYAPEADPTLLCNASAGNPLIAIELARAITLGENGSSLDELVVERVARCDVEVAEVIRWAALLAPRVDAHTLERVTGLDAARIGRALDVAERHALVQLTDQGFRFAHDLVARYVYADISPVRRRVMHRRVAELLEKDTVPDVRRAPELAHHATQSGDAGLAARAMVSAGRLCLRFFANDDALQLARKGAHFAAQLPDADRVRLTLELREIRLSAASTVDWEKEAAECIALAEAALDHGALAHARLGYHLASYLRWDHGHWAHAREATLQAERVTRHAGDEDQIVGMAETAKCLAMLERDLSHADALLLEASSRASRGRQRVPAIPAALGMLRYYENRLDEAEELFKEARTLYKSAGDRLNEYQANEYLAMVEIERGRFDAARTRCTAMLELAEKLRDGSEGPFARAMDALCRYASHDEDALAEPLEALRVVDAKHALAYTLNRAAAIDRARNRHDRAIVRAREALECAEILERASERLMAHTILAQSYDATRKPAHARAQVEAIAAMSAVPVAEWARQQAAAATQRMPERRRR
jgi:DNA-binding SARP family transcriptional activator